MLSASKSLRRCYIHIRQVSSSKQAEITRCYNKIDLKFENTKEAFRSKTSFELLRGIIVLRLCSFQWLVKNQVKIMQLSRKILGSRIYKAAMKSGFYGHFVAGETVSEVLRRVQRMQPFGVKAILDYSVESDMSDSATAEEENTVNDSKTQTRPTTKINPGGNLPVGGEAFPQIHLGPASVHLEQYQAEESFLHRSDGVVSARTYFYQGEPECDRNCEIFLDCIDNVRKATDGVGLAAIKLTALGRPKLLLQLSEVIAQTQNFYKVLTGATWENLVNANLTERDFLSKLEEFGIKTESDLVKEWFSQADFDKDGFVDLYEWGRILEDGFRLSKMFKVLNLKTGKLEHLMSHLTLKEEQQFQNMMSRMQRIADRAKSLGVRVMVDAEQSYFQPAISRLTLELMRKYNGNDAVIFNTYQCYLKNALTNVQIDMQICRRENLSFGAKLVRGAYMEQERQRAATLGYGDPILPTFDATSKMYDDVVAEVVKEATGRPLGAVSVMCATHNEDAVRNVVKLMKKHQIAPSDRILCFAQLYGMCDHVSFSLGQAGYSVYKYVPYGPVEDVMPYLSRRAQEHGGSGVFSKAVKERQLMSRELKRRLLSRD